MSAPDHPGPRGGGYAEALTAMLDRLASPDLPALRGLTARDTGDPAIALADAAAVLADLLEFHTARIAEEGYLRSARDQWSLGMLGRLVGYRPRPGETAGTYLAYTLDGRSAGDAEVVIPRGSRSRSVPGAAGEQPRTFETDAELTGRAEWNELPVRRRRPGLLVPDDLSHRSAIYVAGTDTLLATGDRLVFLFGTGATATHKLVAVAGVEPDPAEGVTALRLPTSPPPSLDELVEELRQWITEPADAGGVPTADDPNPRPASPLITGFDAQVLAPLRNALPTLTTPEAFTGALAGPVRRLSEAIALAGRSPEVAAWFARLQAVLAGLSARAQDVGGPGPRTPPGLPADVARLALIGSGRRPMTPARTPAAPPADNAMGAIIASRVTATPFGADARPQPVRDAEGRTVTVTDWPLPGATLTMTRVVFDSAGRTAVRAELAYAQPEQAVARAADLPGGGAFPLGPGRAEVSSDDRAVSVRLHPGLPDATLTVGPPGEDRSVRVTVDDQSADLAPGDPERRLSVGPYEVTVRYVTGTQPAAVEIGMVTVPDEARRVILPLDHVYDTVAAGSWVAIERPGKAGPLAQVLTRVTEARTVAYAAYGTTGRGTQLTLADPWLDADDVLLSAIRDATVYAAGEPLLQADEPEEEDVHGDRVELSADVPGLRPGRTLAVTGERTDLPGTTGVTGTEIAVIAAVTHGADPDVPGDAAHTTITLTRDLAYRYKRSTVRILGNVVAASEGESRDEPIGSGDATVAYQTFTLWQEPLAWRPAANPLGARPELEILVNGLVWHRVDSLAGRGPAERVYVLDTGPDGRATVTFGDGVTGARVPTGHENVRARYRFGGGAAGDLPAGRITQAVTRPLGVAAVTNPVPSTGGADPDGPGLARRRIPLAVSALDRLVSVPDYADFARSRVGIGRAAARELYDGRRSVVHVTVTGVNDAPLDVTDPSSGPLAALRDALARYGDPRFVRVDVRELLSLRLVIGVTVRRDHAWDVVRPRLREALVRRLGYPGRDLARDAYLSDVLATAQSVPGVDHVDVDVFTTAGRPDEVRGAVHALPARRAEDVYEVTARNGETLTQVATAAHISLDELVRLNPGITSTATLPAGRAVVTFRGIRPAQFAVLPPDPDALILKERP